jgi:hypothetical protein
MRKKMNEKEKPKEAKGLINSLLNFLGMAISIVGIVLTFSMKVVGSIVWIVGTALLVWSLVRGIRNTPKGLGVANTVMKIVLLSLSLLFFIILLTAKP